MLEPIGGSAPKYTGQDVVNPMAAIAACPMMLVHLDDTAITHVLPTKLTSMQAGKMGYTDRAGRRSGRRRASP